MLLPVLGGAVDALLRLPLPFAVLFTHGQRVICIWIY